MSNFNGGSILAPLFLHTKAALACVLCRSLHFPEGKRMINEEETVSNGINYHWNALDERRAKETWVWLFAGVKLFKYSQENTLSHTGCHYSFYVCFIFHRSMPWKVIAVFFCCCWKYAKIKTIRSKAPFPYCYAVLPYTGKDGVTLSCFMLHVCRMWYRLIGTKRMTVELDDRATDRCKLAQCLIIIQRYKE